MTQLKDLPTELKSQLQAIAIENNVLLMSFIAPDSIVRKSPITWDYATITVQDLYDIEQIIEELREKEKLPEKLHLIIQTRGGAADVSTKIAKYLQSSFDVIEAYVPYEAASGGTMLCLAANTIVMDLTSNLTPIDPQVRYKNQRISVTSYKQAIMDFQKEFAIYRPDELPSPYQQMGNQFDPIILKEMEKQTWDTLDVAYSLLLRSQKPKTDKDRYKLIETVIALGKTNYPHTHIIAKDEAEKIGLNISKDDAKLKLLKIYKKWVSLRLKEEETTHIKEKFCPEDKKHEKKESPPNFKNN